MPESGPTPPKGGIEGECATKAPWRWRRRVDVGVKIDVCAEERQQHDERVDGELKEDVEDHAEVPLHHGVLQCFALFRTSPLDQLADARVGIAEKRVFGSIDWLEWRVDALPEGPCSAEGVEEEGGDGDGRVDREREHKPLVLRRPPVRVEPIDAAHVALALGRHGL
eukprot:scaffold228731_cov33-Tisochrysis_lutea.AAC.4